MEAVNVSPAEVRKTMWHTVLALVFLMVIWRVPDIITAVRWW
ncbi:hypothetical protein PCO31111_05035 [Pandoraea communis]|uniref:Uncharacterized protein n=1 Tax=Pandoraea communis TaxID=2508297 RepID=A0A5E4Z489_9BURK|nr:hypothetical protein PCO31111_05035 [Pandoraea communis]